MSGHHEGPPAFRSPPDGCDAHFHVFGRVEDYPPRDPNLRYAPPYAPLDAFLEHAGHFGLEKFVFVQPSAYARDNTCMLDAMKELRGRWGAAKYDASVRGIVDIDENCSDEMLADMHALGVRGVRINQSPVKPHEPGFGQSMVARIKRFDERFAKIGWMLDFLGPGWLMRELIPTMKTLRVPYSIAHMGMFLAKEGPRQAGFQELLDLTRYGDRRCWIKFTGTYRMATAPDFADAVPMARAAIDAAPDRIIWGSDWPHISFADKVSSVALWNLLGDYAPVEATRRRILVDNPKALFGF